MTIEMQTLSPEEQDFYRELFETVNRDVERLWETRWYQLAHDGGRPAGYARAALVNAMLDRAASELMFREGWDGKEYSRDEFLNFCERAWDGRKNLDGPKEKKN